MSDYRRSSFAVAERSHISLPATPQKCIPPSTVPTPTRSTSSTLTSLGRTKYYHLQALSSQPLLSEQNSLKRYYSMGSLLNELRHFSISSAPEGHTPTVVTADQLRTAATIPLTHRSYIKKLSLQKHCHLGNSSHGLMPINKVPPEKRIFRRSPKSDLYYRFQRQNDSLYESSPPAEEAPVVDPVYLALKQATGIYGRRSSSAFGEDSTPSPRNLSQGSLQDSGFSEVSYSTGSMVRSTPLLPQSGIQQFQLNNSLGQNGRKRPPKLHKQMKSLSLDCAETPPPIMNTIRSKNRLGVNSVSRLNSSGDLSDSGRSRSPSGPPSRSTPHRVCSPLVNQISYIVVHEYYKDDVALRFGDTIDVVDNGDPLWLHGYNLSNRKDKLICFPSHIVATTQPGEQPMLTTQTIYSPEAKERIYRDTVVFAQPDTIADGRVLVRTEHNVFLRCPLQHVRLL